MFQSNRINLIISIIAAIAIWVYVISFIDPMNTSTIRSIPVELTNIDTLEDDGLTVDSKQLFTVDVVVKGQRSDLIRLEDNKADLIKITANMTGRTLGENSVEVKLESIPNYIEEVEIHPERINVVVEELVYVTKPVRITYEGDIPKDVEPGNISISPQEVEVSGTKEVVDSVAYVSTVVNIEDLSEDEGTFNTELVAVNDKEQPIYNVNLSQSTADITATLLHIKEVPFIIDVEGDPKGENSLTNIDKPETIFIRGTEKDIEDVKEITANKINITGLEETMIFIPDLQLPEGVELANKSLKLSVTVEIQGIIASSISFTANQIEIEGLPLGYTAHVNTGIINVNVFGTREVIEEISKKNLTPYVDLNGVNLASSSVELEVKFKNADDFERVESIPATVRVNIVRNTNIEAEATAFILGQE